MATGSAYVPTRIPGLDGTAAKATAVACGAYHACVLTSTGEVQCWGANYYGQVGSGTIGGTVLMPAVVSFMP